MLWTSVSLTVCPQYISRNCTRGNALIFLMLFMFILTRSPFQMKLVKCLVCLLGWSKFSVTLCPIEINRFKWILKTLHDSSLIIMIFAKWRVDCFKQSCQIKKCFMYTVKKIWFFNIFSMNFTEKIPFHNKKDMLR